MQMPYPEYHVTLCAHQEELAQKHRLEQEGSCTSLVATTSAVCFPVPQPDCSIVQTSSLSHGIHKAERLGSLFPQIIVGHINGLVEDTRSHEEQPVAAITRQQDNPVPGALRRNLGWLDGWEVEQMRLSQIEDEDIGRIMIAKEARNGKPSWVNISRLSAGYKALWGQWDRLEVRGGLLFRKFIAAANEEHWQLRVPKSKQREVFQHLHEHNTGGHLGASRTLGKVRLAFYWPWMRDSIEKMCSSVLQGSHHYRQTDHLFNSIQ